MFSGRGVGMHPHDGLISSNMDNQGMEWPSVFYSRSIDINIEISNYK